MFTKLLLLITLLIPTITNAGEVAPPKGFDTYCKASPTLKECYLVKSSRLVPSNNALSDLVLTNQLVNTKMVYQPDVITYGTPDVWNDPTNWIGDCEDSVVKKIHILHSNGWSADSLRIATVKFNSRVPDTIKKAHSNSTEHVVLLALGDEVHYVLDITTDRVLTFNEYVKLFNVTFITVQSLNGSWIAYE